MESGQFKTAIGDIERDINNRVGNNLREIRRAKNKSQREVAAAIGVSYQQLQKYESGANRISAAKLALFCTSMGIGMGDTFVGVLVDMCKTNIGREKAILQTITNKFALGDLADIRIGAIGFNHDQRKAYISVTIDTDCDAKIIAQGYFGLTSKVREALGRDWSDSFEDYFPVITLKINHGKEM